MRTNPKFVILLLGLFFLTLSQVQAQEEAYIYGDEVICPFGCGSWEVEFPTSDDFVYSWTIFEGSLPNPNDPPIVEITTEGYEPITACDLPPGFYNIYLTISDFNGNVISQGSYSFWVEDFSQQIFGEAYGSIATSCTQLDSLYFSFPNTDMECYEVCIGTQSSINLEDIVVYDQAGGVSTIDPSQGSWSIINGTGTSSGTSVEIVWNEEGQGRAIFSFWYVTFNGCEAFGEIDFCFDVTPSPTAGFTTLPEADPITGLLEICEGQTVFFFSQSTDAETHLWDFGDGGGSSLADPQYTYNTAGTYEIALITTTGCDCVDTSRMTVIVEGNETPFVDCLGTICENTSVTYTANTGCSSYGWTVSGNGTILDGGGNTDDYITIQWGAGPIGEITLETDGCPDLSTCTTAAYLQVPIVSATATIEGPTQVCRGEQSVYSVPPFEGTGFNWSVSSFGTIIAGQGTPSVTIEWFDGFIPNDTQLVSVDYSNCYLECGGSAQLPVNVRPEFYLTGEIEVCENSSADYGVINTQTNIGFPANFNVSTPDGTIVWSSPGAGDLFTIDWNFGAGNFVVTATPQNPSDFCMTTVEFLVAVTPQPDAVPAIDGQSDICPGIAYTYSVDSPVDGERYRWVVTNGASVTEREGETIAVVWNAAGPYSLSVVRLSPPLYCSSASTDLTINTVSSFAISGDDQVCLDQTAFYTSDQTGDVYYDWYIVPANAGTIAEDPTTETIEILWHTAGAATVVLDICGQQETFNVNVNAPPQPTVNHPASICPGTTDVVSTTTAFTTYSWQDEEGNELSTSATPDLGGGYYRLEVTDALGCVGKTTFQIYEYPSSNISISTPDFNLFCNSPAFTRMYAINTEDGYTYQWYQDGTAITGETGTNYTATTFGVYRVDIIDENGCAFSSNSINVIEDCDGIGSNNPGLSCNNPGHTFTVTDNGSCDDRAYSATATGSIPGTIFWIFDDPDSGANNFGSGENITHQYTKPGFYRVLMGAAYDDGAGGQTSCRIIIPDTVYAVADFDYDGVCPGAPVQFYDLSTFLEFTNIVAWDWNFGDPSSGANTATDKDPVHTFSGDGDYLVSLTVTTGLGCTATVTQTVSIFPLPSTNFAEPDVTCAATALTFLADVEATVADVSWNFGDAASGDANTSTLFTSYHQYDAVGNYTINLEATSIYGCTNTFSRSIDITPNTLSGEIDPAGLSVLCEGDQISLNAPANGATTWLWSNGEPTQSITVGTAEAYLVTLTDVDGCTYTPEAAVIDIIPAPQSPIRSVVYNDFNQPSAYTYDSLFVCYGEDIFLETQQQTGYTYQWSNGDTDTNTEFSEDRGNLLTEGEHIVTLDVTDTSNGCSATEVFVIIVHPTPDIPVLAGGGALCAGTSSTISVNNAQGNLIYLWSSGESATSINTDEAGEYYVTAINVFGCRSESEILEINAGPDISLVPSGCHTRCAPDTLCLPTIPNVISYQWYQDGVAIPAPEGDIAELIIDESGSYTLEMEDINGCLQTTNPLTIDLQPGYGTILGNVFYDNNDNGVIDTGDDFAEDIAVVLDDPTSNIDVIETDITGTYGFIDIPEGDYTLSIDTLTVPDGWKPQIQSIDTTFMGCDQEIEILWLLVPDCDIDTTFTASVCEGEDFLFQGVAYPIGSDNSVVVSVSDNCDSTFMFTVEALPSSDELLAIEVCAGETYEYQGLTYGAGTDETFLMMNSSGCDSTVQLVVTETPEASFSLATEDSCPAAASGSAEISTTAGQAPFVYSIDGNNFQTTELFNNLNPGNYELTIEDANGCQYTESFDIDQLPSLVVFTKDEIRDCASTSVLLQPEILSGDDGQLQFLWSDGVTTLERETTDLGTFSLQVSNGCEVVNATINIEPEVAAEGDIVYVPNAFSPNNDGFNDEFRVYPGPDAQIEGIDFQVYDRWGKLVFDADAWDDQWLGIIRGRQAVSGTYVWRLEATVNLCGQMIDVVRQGDLILVR